MRYFLDTYALVEIIKGNSKYARFVSEELFTNILNLYELYYVLSRDYDAGKAKKYFYEFKDILIEIEEEYIFLASKIKLGNKQISYVDALGYANALKKGIKFLTGDKEFENMDNVEFVKK